MIKEITCPHCGKSYEDDFTYCPYCAEPKPSPKVSKDEEIDEEIKRKNATIGIESVLFTVFSFVPIYIVIYIIAIIKQILTPVEDMYAYEENALRLIPNGKVVLVIAIILSVMFGVIYFVSWKIKNKRNKIIAVQFEKDQTSVCPHCGSHNISLGRKGYDWKKGFWYRMFNLKGGHYLAGMDSRQVIGYCNDCKHKWETNKQWIR